MYNLFLSLYYVAFFYLEFCLVIGVNAIEPEHNFNSEIYPFLVSKDGVAPTASFDCPTSLSMTGIIACDESGVITALAIGDLETASTFYKGVLPTTIGRLSSLDYLLLANLTSFGGSIPTEVGNLDSLSNFVIENITSMSGPLPSELGRLTRLELISLRNTSIHGPIPTHWSGMNSLIKLMLRDMPIGGSIPWTLANNPFLEHLSLISCELEGMLPPELGSLFTDVISTVDINLQYNLLSGSIPSEWRSAYGESHINRLQLQGNRLSGSIAGLSVQSTCRLWLFSNESDASAHDNCFACDGLQIDAPDNCKLNFSPAKCMCEAYNPFAGSSSPVGTSGVMSSAPQLQPSSSSSSSEVVSTSSSSGTLDTTTKTEAKSDVSTCEDFCDSGLICVDNRCVRQNEEEDWLSQWLLPLIVASAFCLALIACVIVMLCLCQRRSRLKAPVGGVRMRSMSRSRRDTLSSSSGGARRSYTGAKGARRSDEFNVPATYHVFKNAAATKAPAYTPAPAPFYAPAPVGAHNKAPAALPPSIAIDVNNSNKSNYDLWPTLKAENSEYESVTSRIDKPLSVYETVSRAELPTAPVMRGAGDYVPFERVPTDRGLLRSAHSHSGSSRRRSASRHGRSRSNTAALRRSSERRSNERSSALRRSSDKHNKLN